MKTFTTVLAVLFMAVFCYQATSSPTISLNFYGPCCDNPGQYSKPLPLSRVVKYIHTGSHCFLPAVIFTTIKGKLVCASPNDVWVQDIIKSIEGQ